MPAQNEVLPIIYGMTCTVVSQQKKILLLKRSPDKKVFPNLWAVVGAYPFKEKVDMTEVAMHEIEDELGLSGEIIKVGNEIIKNVEDNGHRVELHVIPVLALVTSEDVVLNEEHTEYRWVSIEELSNFDLAPGILDAINAVDTVEYLKNIQI